MRFSPRTFPIPRELALVLRQAFSERDQPGAEDVPTPGVDEWVRKLDLGPRIFVSPQAGPQTRRMLAAEHLAALAAHELIMAAATDVARTALELEMKPIFVKHVGLALGGYIQPGARDVRDVDVLVEQSDAASLQKTLIARGAEECGYAPRPHHLPSLRLASGALVEVHTMLPGLSIAARPATAEGILQSGACEAAVLGGYDVLIPNRITLGAHAVVHGFARHGATPESYPLFKLISDVVDLKLNVDRDLASIVELTSEQMSLAEVEAVLRLGHYLRRGESPPTDSGAAVLLRHLILAYSDTAYRRSLKLHRLRLLRDPAERGALFRRILWPTQAELERDYGSASGLFAGVVRRSLHPLRMAWGLLLATTARAEVVWSRDKR